MRRQNDQMAPGSMGFSSIHRRTAELSLNEVISITAHSLEHDKRIYLSMVEFEVSFLSRTRSEEEYDCDMLAKKLKDMLDLQFVTIGQKLVMEVFGINLAFKVKDLAVVDLRWFKKKEKEDIGGGSQAAQGLMTKKTDVAFVKEGSSQIRLKGGSGGASARTTIFRPDWNFENMGIGGLDAEFANIFRRAFASRVFPPAVVARLGISHVKGILLYGPPGTGKTLMARQIGKMLNGKEPKVVNGPEILNKYVGASEENIRELFRDAEMEYKARGDDSDLHIIIFDELDAICRQRGTTGGGTGVHDTVVNQMLSKIDGVESLNNVLIIGMTNRKDMIDEALLRPGRLEVHVEIALPNEGGRAQIFRIHTNKMDSNGYLAKDVNVGELASLTKNYTGAEIEGLVKSACSFAFNRQIDGADLTKPVNPEEVVISRQDFMLALEEVKPKFGVSAGEMESHIANGIINYGPAFQKLLHTGRLFMEQVQNSDRTPLVTVLLEGRKGSGKTALGATFALESSFPFVRLITPEDLVGHTDAGKCAYINSAFEDAYKSSLSCIIIDDLERLLEFVPIGLRFSNMVLQTLLVLLTKPPPKGKKLLVFGTTSSKQILQDMGLSDAFNAALSIPCVRGGAEARCVLEELKVFDSDPQSLELAVKSVVEPIPIKTMIMVAEMAKQGDHLTIGERFIQCMEDYGAGRASQYSR